MREYRGYDVKEMRAYKYWRVELYDRKPYYLEKGSVVETVTEAEHGDWKTALAQGIPRIPKGTKLIVNEVWRNFYGVWVSVDYNGRNYDIRPSQLKYVCRTEE